MNKLRRRLAVSASAIAATAASLLLTSGSAFAALPTATPFTIASTGKIGTCLTLIANRIPIVSQLTPCTVPASTSQQWTYNSGTQAVTSVANPNLCLAAAVTLGGTVVAPQPSFKGCAAISEDGLQITQVLNGKTRYWQAFPGASAVGLSGNPEPINPYQLWVIAAVVG